VQIYKPPLECIWLDIGRVEDFQQSLKVFEANKEKFLKKK
jgi:hypothetical protein